MDTLLSWVRVSDLEQADVPAVLALVRDALRELEPDEQAAEALQAIEEQLLAGHVPVWELQRFAQDFDVASPQFSECEQLESEFRRIAAELPEEEWRTPRIGEIEAWLDGAEVDLEAIRATVLSSWNRYQQTPLSADEVTAETVVGHRLLLEGLEGWLEALDALEAEEEGALEQAEAANRLLVAVQKLHQRVAAQARS